MARGVTIICDFVVVCYAYGVEKNNIRVFFFNVSIDYVPDVEKGSNIYLYKFYEEEDLLCCPFECFLFVLFFGVEMGEMGTRVDLAEGMGEKGTNAGLTGAPGGHRGPCGDLRGVFMPYPEGPAVWEECLAIASSAIVLNSRISACSHSGTAASVEAEMTSPSQVFWTLESSSNTEVFESDS
ncbi:MAG: hypothetical protein AAGJ80_09465, partial [Cyanobacteria bacterium J06553_1]